MISDDAVGDSEAESGRRSGLLGGEERFEHPLSRALIHADAFVADADAGVLAGDDFGWTHIILW